MRKLLAYAGMGAFLAAGLVVGSFVHVRVTTLLEAIVLLQALALVKRRF